MDTFTSVNFEHTPNILPYFSIQFQVCGFALTSYFLDSRFKMQLLAITFLYNLHFLNLIMGHQSSLTVYFSIAYFNPSYY